MRRSFVPLWRVGEGGFSEGEFGVRRMTFLFDCWCVSIEGEGAKKHYELIDKYRDVSLRLFFLI